VFTLYFYKVNLQQKSQQRVIEHVVRHANPTLSPVEDISKINVLTSYHSLPSDTPTRSGRPLPPLPQNGPPMTQVAVAVQ
jgi:hypothetical protein